jgi:ubiquitin thioesterase OTU1
LAAQVIMSDPKTYNEGFLGEKPRYYAQNITNLNVFGGGIELKIFSDYFKIEICSFDIQTCREDHFGINKGYSRKGLLLYTGDHYDVLALAKYGGAQESDDQGFDLFKL